MAVKIRLRVQGRKNRPFYRLVAADSRSPRDGRYLESLGWYNPLDPKEENQLSIKAERVTHWIQAGAQMSEKAEALIRRGAPAILQGLHERLEQKRQKRRAARRKRVAAKKEKGAS